MSAFLHAVFVVVANLVGWAMLAALIIVPIGWFWVMFKGRGNGGSSNNQGGLPWL